MKRKWQALLLGLSMAAGLLGCNSPDGGKAQQPGTSGTAAESAVEAGSSEAETGEAAGGITDGGGETLKVMIQTTARSGSFDSTLEYLSEKLNVKFDVEEIPDGDTGDQVIAARINSGDEVPDLLIWQYASYEAARTNPDKYTDLSDLENLKYYENVDTATRYYTMDGVMSHVPMGATDIFGFAYNKSVFEEYGLEIPTTYEELNEVCQKLEGSGVTPIYLAGGAAWTLQIPLLDAFSNDYNANPDMINQLDNHEIEWVDMPYSLERLENMNSWVKNGYVQETYLSDTYEDAQSALFEGTCAMFPCASYIVPQMKKLVTDEEQLANIGMFVMPTADGKGVAGYSCGTSPSVPAQAEHVELAKWVINEWMHPDTVKYQLTIEPFIPMAQTEETEFVGIIKDAYDILQDGRGCMQVEALTKYNKGSLELYIQDMLIGNRTPEDVLAELDNDFRVQAIDAGDPNWAE